MEKEKIKKIKYIVDRNGESIKEFDNLQDAIDYYHKQINYYKRLDLKIDIVLYKVYPDIIDSWSK